MQTLRLNKIVQSFSNAIKNSEEIKQYINENYGKTLKILVGYNGRKPPKEQDCPFFAFSGLVKQEGEDIGEHTYHISMMWCISNDKTEESEGVIKYLGAEDSAELGQLIYNAIAVASENYTIDQANTTIDAFSFHPQFPGYMEATIKIPSVIGGGEIEF